MKKDLLNLKKELLNQNLVSYANHIDYIIKKTASTPLSKAQATRIMIEISKFFASNITEINKWQDVYNALEGLRTSSSTTKPDFIDQMEKSESNQNAFIFNATNAFKCSTTPYYTDYVTNTFFIDNSIVKTSLEDRYTDSTKQFCIGGDAKVHISFGKIPAGTLKSQKGVQTLTTDDGTDFEIIYTALRKKDTKIVFLHFHINNLTPSPIPQYDQSDVLDGTITLKIDYSSQGAASYILNSSCADNVELKKGMIVDLKQNTIKPFVEELFARGFYNRADAANAQTQFDGHIAFLDDSNPSTKNNVTPALYTMIDDFRKIFAHADNMSRSDGGPNGPSYWLENLPVTLPNTSCKELPHEFFAEIESFMSTTPDGPKINVPGGGGGKPTVPKKPKKPVDPYDPSLLGGSYDALNEI